MNRRREWYWYCMVREDAPKVRAALAEWDGGLRKHMLRITWVGRACGGVNLLTGIWCLALPSSQFAYWGGFINLLAFAIIVAPVERRWWRMSRMITEMRVFLHHFETIERLVKALGPIVSEGPVEGPGSPQEPLKAEGAP